MLSARNAIGGQDMQANTTGAARFWQATSAAAALLTVASAPAQAQQQQQQQQQGSPDDRT